MNSLAPLSAEQNHLDLILREWAYTGEKIDYEEAIETCQLCGHEALRYHFRIENQQTSFSLLIGSECIKRFDIGVLVEDGTLVHGQAASQIVDAERKRLQEETRRKRMIEALRKLWRADVSHRVAIEKMVEYVKRRGAFTPPQMSLLAWRMKECRIPHAPRDFKVIMRRKRERAVIIWMEDWKFISLLPYLNVQQRISAERLRTDP